MLSSESMAFFLFHFFLNCAGIIGFQLHAAQNVFAAQQVCTGFHLHLNCALGGVDVEMVARVLAFAAVVFHTLRQVTQVHLGIGQSCTQHSGVAGIIQARTDVISVPLAEHMVGHSRMAGIEILSIHSHHLGTLGRLQQFAVILDAALLAALAECVTIRIV